MPRDFDSRVSLSLPVLKVASPGRVQLAKDQVVKTLKDAKGGSVSFEALPPRAPPPTRRRRAGRSSCGPLAGR